MIACLLASMLCFRVAVIPPETRLPWQVEVSSRSARRRSKKLGQ